MLADIVSQPSGALTSSGLWGNRGVALPVLPASPRTAPDCPSAPLPGLVARGSIAGRDALPWTAMLVAFRFPSPDGPGPPGGCRNPIEKAAKIHRQFDPINELETASSMSMN